MGSTPSRPAEATDTQMEDLRGLAIRDLTEAGFENPSEQAIQSRLGTLLQGNNVHPPEPSQSKRVPPKSRSRCSPGLALVQDFCQKQGHKADLRVSAKRRGEPVDHPEGRVPYYFAPLPDDYIDHFARFLPPSAGLIVWALFRYAKTDMQTWVSQDTLVMKTGVCENTLKRDMRLLIECKVVQRGPAGGTDFDGNPIRKLHGYKYRLNMPLAWDKERVRHVSWRKSGGIAKENSGCT
ncbi:MAG: helix-turn-helix domain-containing protein [Candidatus Eisenbacteria bacterium]